MATVRISYEDLERCAMGFVLEDETWPVFIEWLRKNGTSEAAIKFAQGNHREQVRTVYMLQSPDPIVRAAGIFRLTRQMKQDDRD